LKPAALPGKDTPVLPLPDPPDYSQFAGDAAIAVGLLIALIVGQFLKDPQ